MTRSALLALVALLVFAPMASAQQPEPLQKSDVVRLLSGGTYTQAEVASMVERSCLSFRPTERDMENFRALGAGDRVMAAIRDCAESPRQPSPRPEQRPATQPRETPPARPSPADEGTPMATLFVSPRQTSVAPGEDVEVTVELTLGASPVADARVALRRGTPGEGGEVIATAVTGPEGRATLRVPAAEGPGLRWFSVVALDRPMRGENVVEVRTERPADATPLVRGPADAESRSSGDERPSTPEEEDGRQLGATAPADVSPVARSVPLLPEGVPIEDREAALAEARRFSLEGQYGHAEAIFRRLFDEGDREVGVLLEYARHLTRAGEHGEADRVLARAETLEPSNVEALKARAFVKLWLDQPAQAVRRYRRAVEMDPRDVGAWRGLARALAADGRPEEAREASRRAAELEPPG